MATLFADLGIAQNPFEHYTAETEPNIAEYAVRPPYLQTAKQRASGLTSFILFGDRGVGKSATRITLFNEIWGSNGDEKRPLVVSLIDFTTVLSNLRKGSLAESHIIELIAFNVIEQVLSWLSSLTDDERDTYVQALDNDEMKLVAALVRSFYLNRSEMDRSININAALKLLNKAWKTRSSIWIAQRWDALAKITGAVAEMLSQKLGGAKVAEPVQQLMSSLEVGKVSSPRIVLSKLVDFVRTFGFTGIVVLIDKVDETEVTQTSSEMSASLVYPILSHIQLLEVEGFSWVFFLWAQIKQYFEGEKYPVRLDKIAHATIAWEDKFFTAMLDTRMEYFSSKKLLGLICK